MSSFNCQQGNFNLRKQPLSECCNKIRDYSLKVLTKRKKK